MENLSLIISEQGKELEEIPEKVDDVATIQIRQAEATLEQTDMFQQIVELRNQMTSSNAALQNLDVHEKKMAELLENCKGIEVNLMLTLK